MSRIPCRTMVMVTCLLLCTSESLQASNNGGSAVAAVPTFPYVDRNGYNDKLTGRWQLTAPATVVSGAGPNATIITLLPKGTTVNAIAIEALTSRPAVCEVVKDGSFEVRQWVRRNNTNINSRVQKVPFRRGDRVYELDYYGEGECSIWFKGVTGVAECKINGITGGPEFCRYSGQDKPTSEIWAYVQTINGKRGWIRQPKAKGMSQDD